MQSLNDLKQEVKVLLSQQRMETLFGKLKETLSVSSPKFEELRSLEIRARASQNSNGRRLKLELNHLIEDLQEKDIAANYFQDPRDGQYYRTVTINGQTWMAHNLNFALPADAWWYRNQEKNGEKYGRLYTWESARQACPPGWRLPTDLEWRELIQHFGGRLEKSSLSVTADPRQAYKALILGGDSGFDAQLGGWCIPAKGGFSNLGADGCYFSATEASSREAWCYTFSGLAAHLRRSKFVKDYGLSVRCVTDG